MARFKAILAYDGTAFQGFQRQVNARTVQAAVEEALTHLGWQEASILAAGRTDAGVHALGQVISFDLDWKHSNQKLRDALNALLPMDVAVQQVDTAKAGFHPRYDALDRTYCYVLFCAPVRHPLRERYAWRVWPPVDGEKLELVARKLVGQHNFAAFGTPMQPGGSTERIVYHAKWQQQDDEWRFTIRANAYLYHMVRRLVYLQVAIGQGRVSENEIDEALIGAKPPQVQGLAPPQGLFLTLVRYSEQDEVEHFDPRVGLFASPDRYRRE
jgi:tRNA pseudouridine38-40 synthase